MRRERCGIEDEEVGRADPRIIGVGVNRSGDPFLTDQTRIETGRQSVAQYRIDHVEDIIVWVSQPRLVKPDDQRWFGIELHFHTTLPSLKRLNGDDRGLRRRGRYRPERLLDQRHDVLWIDITHDGDRRIARTIVCLEEGLGVSRRE